MGTVHFLAWSFGSIQEKYLKFLRDRNKQKPHCLGPTTNGVYRAGWFLVLLLTWYTAGMCYWGLTLFYYRGVHLSDYTNKQYPSKVHAESSIWLWGVSVLISPWWIDAIKFPNYCLFFYIRLVVLFNLLIRTGLRLLFPHPSLCLFSVFQSVRHD